MRAYSLNELICLTRTELFALYYAIVAEIPALPSAELETAVANMRLIRRVLAHPQFAPS